MKILVAAAVLAVAGSAYAQQSEIAKWDPRMAADNAVVDTNDVKWIDGKFLPIEGRWTLGDTQHYYMRLPDTLTTNVNGGVMGMPIVMAEQCDVFCRPANEKDKFIRSLYDKLVAEGWKDLVYLPKDGMFTGDFEGTVDGCHPNDLGMVSMAKAFGGAVKEALHLK